MWVASGQSNMEFPLQRSKGGADQAALGCSGLRLFTVANPPAATPATKVGGEWRACDAANAAAFSAAAFHFGRELHRALGLPVGIIQAAVGGTPAEAWTPREALRAEPTLAPMVEALDRAMTDTALHDELAKKLAAWEAKNFHQDQANRGEKAGWARAGGGKWETMEIPQLWENAGLAIDGAVWFRREVTVPEAWLGGDLALSLGAVDDFDVTYWNGERVGATGAETPQYWSAPRRYKIPGRLVKAGRNVLAVRVFDHYGNGGFAAAAAQMNLRRVAPSNDGDEAPVPLAGTWSYKVERKLKPAVADWNTRPKLLGTDDPTSPTVLWNALVAPYAGLPIAGVIWYQGESNVERAAQYRTLFPLMIRAWRAAWNDSKLPFLFVQLPNFEEKQPKEPKQPPGDSAWAELREAQALALREPRTAMAVTLDIGDAHDIHPREKQEVGRRLALAALKLVYGRDVIASGPTFTAAVRDGKTIKVRFTNVASGLTTVRRRGAQGVPDRGRGSHLEGGGGAHRGRQRHRLERGDRGSRRRPLRLGQRPGGDAAQSGRLARGALSQRRLGERPRPRRRPSNRRRHARDGRIEAAAQVTLASHVAEDDAHGLAHGDEVRAHVRGAVGLYPDRVAVDRADDLEAAGVAAVRTKRADGIAASADTSRGS